MELSCTESLVRIIININSEKKSTNYAIWKPWDRCQKKKITIFSQADFINEVTAQMPRSVLEAELLKIFILYFWPLPWTVMSFLMMSSTREKKEHKMVIEYMGDKDLFTGCSSSEGISFFILSLCCKTFQQYPTGEQFNFGTKCLSVAQSGWHRINCPYFLCWNSARRQFSG